MAARIAYPVLNIYLGTSPIEVGRYVNRQVRHLPQTDQRKVASLFIDTMPIQEERINGQRTYGSDTMQIVIPRYQGGGAWSDEQRHHMYIETGGLNTGGSKRHKPGISAAGAGGIRNNGHVAFCSWASSIMQSISDKLDLINAPPPSVQDERAAASLRINIVAFLGGGTGSGALPALALISRYILMRKNVVPQTAIYAILPEQPRGATEDMRRRQRSNACSTLLELTTLLRLKNEHGPVTFHFGALQIDVSAIQVFDLLYLYGHGKLTDHSEIYQHIGLDLFTRMQDAHGAGAERMRQLPDLSSLQETDGRSLPTCAATSGITEVIFPREELLGALARRASRIVLATQVSELNNDEKMRVEKFANDLATMLLKSLQSELENAQNKHAPEPFDIDIIDRNQDWGSDLSKLIEVYSRDLRFSRNEIVRKIREELVRRIQEHIIASRDAVFDRYRQIYREIYNVVRREAEAPVTASRAERDFAFEESAFNPPWFRRRNPGRFAQYANEQLEIEREYVDQENRRSALDEIIEWLDREIERHRLEFDRFQRLSTSGDNLEDRRLIEEGRLPLNHKYTRSALPTPELIDALYCYLLQQSRLEKEGTLNVARVIDEVHGSQRSRDGSMAELSDKTLEMYFVEKFRRALENPVTHEPMTVHEIILKFGGEPLLRQHMRWGIEWARGHLNYHMYQEALTNGRIARQLDIAMMFGSEGHLIREIMNEESTRSEVQNGMKLLASVEPDRITFLYTEYAIALRAIDGMHESVDSYLADYCLSQQNWLKYGTMPPHSSNYYQWEVSYYGTNNDAMVKSFADDPLSIDEMKLYSGISKGSILP